MLCWNTIKASNWGEFRNYVKPICGSYNYFCMVESLTVRLLKHGALSRWLGHTPLVPYWMKGSNSIIFRLTSFLTFPFGSIQILACLFTAANNIVNATYILQTVNAMKIFIYFSVFNFVCLLTFLFALLVSFINTSMIEMS